MTRFLCAVLSAVRRPTIVVLACALLSGCASDKPPPPMHVAARVESDTVKLTVDNIPPGREITALVLVDDRGGETPARERELITRESGGGGNSGPGVGVGASGGSSSGIHPYISLGYLFSGSDTARRSQRMEAEIPLPDPAIYRAEYRDWRVVVRYRDQLGETREAGIPAPAP
jgi:hypothetical protein